jgi:hypothetical protein
VEHPLKKIKVFTDLAHPSSFSRPAKHWRIGEWNCKCPQQKRKIDVTYPHQNRVIVLVEKRRFVNTLCYAKPTVTYIVK